MTREFKKLSHSLYERKYLVVFCPNYRYRILREEIAEYVQQQIYSLRRQKEGVEVLEMNVRADHVHVILSIPPKYAVSHVMGYLKGKLALRLFHIHGRSHPDGLFDPTGVGLRGTHYSNH